MSIQSFPTGRIYLLGNPIIWWSNLVLLGVFGAAYVLAAFKEQRGYTAAAAAVNADHRSKLLTAAGWLFLGWGLHYIPFYTMGRVLYFHHYFPALLFSSMLSGVILDYIIGKLGKQD